MLLRLVVTVLTSGVALCSHSYREYYLVPSYRTWGNAREYCRQKYTDLATVQDAHDVARLTKLAKAAGRYGWIGLRKISVATWAWSLGGESTSFVHYTNWATPLSSAHNCGAMRADGKWQSSGCAATLPFVCQSDGADGMFAVLTVKTWSAAQAHCRLHGRDLASARSSAENEAVRLLIARHEKESNSSFWIGLFRSKLRWSDGGYSFYRNWYKGQPNHDGNCILAGPNGKWYDRGCNNGYFFYCYAKKSMKFIMRLQFKSNSGNSPFSNSTVTSAILSKIQNKYRGFKVQWRVQPDGKVFKKQD